MQTWTAGAAAAANIVEAPAENEVQADEATDAAAPAEETAAEASQEEPLSPALKKMGSNKNRVGSMFDLLTFSEV